MRRLLFLVRGRRRHSGDASASPGGAARAPKPSPCAPAAAAPAPAPRSPFRPSAAARRASHRGQPLPPPGVEQGGTGLAATTPGGGSQYADAILDGFHPAGALHAGGSSSVRASNAHLDNQVQANQMTNESISNFDVRHCSVIADASTYDTARLVRHSSTVRHIGRQRWRIRRLIQFGRRIYRPPRTCFLLHPSLGHPHQVAA